MRFRDFLNKLVLKPSRDEIFATDGERYRTNSELTPLGVVLYFWDLFAEWCEDVSQKPTWFQRNLPYIIFFTIFYLLIFASLAVIYSFIN